MRIRLQILFFTLVSTCFLANSNLAFADTLQFSAVPGASIAFVGDGANSTFSFPPSGAALSDFRITGESNGVSLVGLLGDITGSFSFALSAISTVGPVETASVTSAGPSQFVIHGDQDFTASLSWVNIRTLGQVGAVNTMAGDLNLTNFSYGGSNTGLLNLLAAGSATISASFTFIPGQDLKSLTSTACSGPSDPCTTSFSGSVASAVPEPISGAFLSLGSLAGFALLCMPRRRV